MTSPTSAPNQSLIRSPILWGLMIFSLALTLPLSYLLNIRFDEAFTLNTTSQGVVYAFKQAIKFEQQAPLYFVVLSVWRNPDSSVFFARLFSVICLPIFVWITAETAKRYVRSVNPLLIAAVVAVHQQAIWSALDIRLYSLMLVLSGVLMLLFYDGYLAEKPKSRSRILYVAVAILSLYTQYYLGFQLVAAAAALLALGRWKALSRYFLDMLIVGLFFIPMLFVIIGQVSQVSGQIDAALSTGELVKLIYQSSVPHFMSAEWIGFELLKVWLVRSVVVGVAALFIIKLVRRRFAEDVALLAMLIVMLAFFVFTLSVVGTQALQHRHMSILILPLVFVPFSALTIFESKKAVFGWLALILFLNIGSFYSAYRPLAKPGDFIRVANFLRENETPNQPVLVFHSDAKLPLSYYYKGQNQLIALPQENGFDVWDPRNNVLRDEVQIIGLINAQPDNPDRFWLVHDSWCTHGSISFNCQLLEDFVEKYFDIESTQEFFGETSVRLLRRKPDY